MMKQPLPFKFILLLCWPFLFTSCAEPERLTEWELVPLGLYHELRPEPRQVLLDFSLDILRKRLAYVGVEEDEVELRLEHGHIAFSFDPEVVPLEEGALKQLVTARGRVALLETYPQNQLQPLLEVADSLLQQSGQPPLTPLLRIPSFPDSTYHTTPVLAYVLPADSAAALERLREPLVAALFPEAAQVVPGQMTNELVPLLNTATSYGDSTIAPFSKSFIEQVQVEPVEDGSVIFLHLNENGSEVLFQLSLDNQYEYLALLVDGSAIAWPQVQGELRDPLLRVFVPLEPPAARALAARLYFSDLPFSFSINEGGAEEE